MRVLEAVSAALSVTAAAIITSVLVAGGDVQLLSSRLYVVSSIRSSTSILVTNYNGASIRVALPRLTKSRQLRMLED